MDVLLQVWTASRSLSVPVDGAEAEVDTQHNERDENQADKHGKYQMHVAEDQPGDRKAITLHGADRGAADLTTRQVTTDDGDDRADKREYAPS